MNPRNNEHPLEQMKSPARGTAEKLGSSRGKRNIGKDGIPPKHPETQKAKLRLPKINVIS